MCPQRLRPRIDLSRKGKIVGLRGQLKMPSRLEVEFPKARGQKKINLADAREARVRASAWLDSPALKRELVLQLREFDLLAKAVDVYNATHSLKAVKAATGLSGRTIRDWLSGKVLPRHVSLKRAAFKTGKRKQLRIKKERESDFGFVLGTFMGNVSACRVSFEKGQGRLSAMLKDENFARTFAQKLLASTGLKAAVSRKGRLFFVDIPSMNLVQLLNELSLYGNRIPADFIDPKSPMKQMLSKNDSPTKFLRSMESRRQFVQAIADSNGGIHQLTSYTRRDGTKTITRNVEIAPANSGVRAFVFDFLRQNGFNPTLRRYGTKKAGAIVLPPNETERFLREIGFNKSVR